MDEKKIARREAIAKIGVAGYLDVKEANQVTTWELTLPSTLSLIRRGWTPRLLVVGETVTAEAFRVRDGSPLANVWLITLSDGRRVPSGVPVDRRSSKSACRKTRSTIRARTASLWASSRITRHPSSRR